MAEAVFTSLAQPHISRIARIDSAGTGAYHELSPPDPRTVATLKAHGITTYDHAARKVTAADFNDFDYILAMDRYNLRDLRDLRKRAVARGKVPSAAAAAAGEGGEKGKVMLFGDFGTGREKGEEVGDPYYGGDEGFEVVFGQVGRFSRGFLNEVLGVDREEER